eukprot:9324920-Pyramimonas_sp.AAC.1
MASRGPKMAPRGAQDGPKTAPRTPKALQEVPKMGPGCYFGGSRGAVLTKEHPFFDRSPPRGAQEAPRGAK